jgi:hypothetical protein
MYKKLSSGIPYRTGIFSKAEDKDLLKNWMKHGMEVNEYQLSTPRDQLSVRQRIRRLLGYIYMERDSELSRRTGVSSDSIKERMKLDPVFDIYMKKNIAKTRKPRVK